MKTITILPFTLLPVGALSAPFELLSKRLIASHEFTRSISLTQPRVNCPALLTTGEFEFPHYITQISTSQPDRAYGPQYTGVFTPNDVSSIFSFDVPASRADANCTLEFIFPRQEDLATSNYNISGAGTFFLEGYAPGSCPGPETTFSNQPAPGPFGAFPAVCMEPGYVYVLDVGPFSIAAGTCISGSKCFLLFFVSYLSFSLTSPLPHYFLVFPSLSLPHPRRVDAGWSGRTDNNIETETSTNDTIFTFFQDTGDVDSGNCPIGVYTTYSYL